MNRNSVFMPKKQQGGKILKSRGSFIIPKFNLETFLFYSFLLPDFVQGYFWALLCFEGKKSFRPCVRACVRPCVRPSVNWLSACISFVFHSNCLKFFEHNHYVWGQIVLTFGATYPKGGTPSPRVTPNGYPLQNLPIEIFFNILNFFIFFPM